MATVEDVAAGVLAAIDSDAGLLLAARWTNDRVRQIAGRTKLRSQRSVTAVTVDGNISTGHIAVVRGSATVTPNSLATVAWSPAIAGRHLRGRSVWYEIEGFTGSEARLRAPWAEDGSTELTYVIVQRVVPVVARWIAPVGVNQRRRWTIESIGLAELDRVAPERPITQGGAQCFAEVGAGLTAEGQPARTIEFYPPSADTEQYTLITWGVPRDLALDEALPPELDEHVLREGVLIDAMRYKMSQALTAGQLEVAAHWRNEYRAQETRWEQRIVEAFSANAAVDDVSVVLRSLTAGPRIDITTARDDIWARGPR